MPIDQEDLATIEDALGHSDQAGRSSPNGHNFQAALNVVTRVAQDMNEYGLGLDDLPEEKHTAYTEAVQDLRYYRQMLGGLFGEKMAGEMDGVELPDGSTVPFPEQA